MYMDIGYGLHLLTNHFSSSRWRMRSSRRWCFRSSTGCTQWCKRKLLYIDIVKQTKTEFEKSVKSSLCHLYTDVLSVCRVHIWNSPNPSLTHHWCHRISFVFKRYKESDMQTIKVSIHTSYSNFTILLLMCKQDSYFDLTNPTSGSSTLSESFMEDRKSKD